MDPYRLLGVPRDVDPVELHAAYRRQARVHHPDHGGSHARMVAINDAYAVLSDPERRAALDHQLRVREGLAPHGTRRANGRIVLRPTRRGTREEVSEPLARAAK